MDRLKPLRQICFRITQGLSMLATGSDREKKRFVLDVLFCVVVTRQGPIAKRAVFKRRSRRDTPYLFMCHPSFLKLMLHLCPGSIFPLPDSTLSSQRIERISVLSPGFADQSLDLLPGSPFAVTPEQVCTLRFCSKNFKQIQEPSNRAILRKHSLNCHSEREPAILAKQAASF